MLRFMGKTAVRAVILGAATVAGVTAAGTVTQPKQFHPPEQQTASTTVTSRSN